MSETDRREPSQLIHQERGASSVEYGLLISAVAAVIALVVFAFGDNVADLFSDTCEAVASQNATSC